MCKSAQVLHSLTKQRAHTPKRKLPSRKMTQRIAPQGENDVDSASNLDAVASSLAVTKENQDRPESQQDASVIHDIAERPVEKSKSETQSKPKNKRTTKKQASAVEAPAVVSEASEEPVEQPQRRSSRRKAAAKAEEKLSLLANKTNVKETTKKQVEASKRKSTRLTKAADNLKSDQENVASWVGKSTKTNVKTSKTVKDEKEKEGAVVQRKRKSKDEGGKNRSSRAQTLLSQQKVTPLGGLEETIVEKLPSLVKMLKFS